MNEERKHIDYSAADIENYWLGNMSPAARHAIETAALDDPFLADALEGYEKTMLAGRPLAPDRNELTHRLTERTIARKKAPVALFAWWKAAAIIVVLLGAAWLYNDFNSKSSKQNIAATNKQTGAPAAPDSAATATVQPAADAAPAERPVTKQAPNGLPVTSSARPQPEQPEASRARDVASSKATSSREKNLDARTAIAEPKSLPADPLRSANKQDDRNQKQESEVNNVRKEDAANTAAAPAPVSANRMNTQNTFSGTVVDASNKPMTGAVIQVPQINLTTQTDNKGHFSFQAPDTALSASVSSVGFEQQKVNLQNNLAANQVVLRPAEDQLNEVVVSGYGTKKKRSAQESKDLSVKVQEAIPVIGLHEYDTYIEKNKKVPDSKKDLHGTVVVSFRVRAEGLGNFNVEQSLDPLLDREAVRLLKEGPAWKLLKGKRASVTYIVHF